ncbi:MAG: hypothetical protein DCC67_09240 [Planctomycetota bacterium]|nr:MAG: hypothetical protein DCC67_09240 [Planctomycetota bacterium]
MTRIMSLLTIAAGLIFGLPDCNGQTESPTVDGPEASDLVERLRGYVLTDDTGDVTAISLPDRTSRVVYAPRRTANGLGATIHALSGPDREGRIAFIEDYFFVASQKDKRHLLKTVRVDGTNASQVFSRPGSAMWATTAAGNGEIGSYVSLAPTGGNVAFISRVENKQMPGALLSEGSVEIWNVNDKTGRDVQVVAIDEPMSWFPDGKRLAYSAFVDRDALPKGVAGLKEFGNYFGEVWDQLPAIHVYNVASKQSELMCVGWQAVVAHDGKAMFVGGWGGGEYRWLRFDLAARVAEPLVLPGVSGALLGDNADGCLLYIGLPTTGEKLQFTTNNSPLRGPKLKLSVKAATPRGDSFQTIVSAIDPRSNASFGPAE